MARLMSGLGIVAVGILLAGTGCNRTHPVETKSASSAPVKTYTLQGEVKRLDAQHQVAVIQHGDIKGWMEAMTMEFPVRNPQEFQRLQVGQRITATVRVQDLDYWLEAVQPLPIR